MKLNHVDTILLVEDIQRSKCFYQDTLGLEVFHDWGSMVVFNDHLALHQAGLLQPQQEISKFIQPGEQGRGNVVIYLQSDDLEGCFQSLTQAGVTVVHGILKLPWERIFRIYDPDGYVIEIGEPH